MNHFDKIFRNKLEHHTVDVPAGSWESIASKLPASGKNGRGIIPLLFTTTGFIILLALVLLITDYNTTNTILTSDSQKNTNKSVQNITNNGVGSTTSMLENQSQTVQKTGEAQLIKNYEIERNKEITNPVNQTITANSVDRISNVLEQNERHRSTTEENDVLALSENNAYRQHIDI
ncbi:MAG: hypothetical protein H7X99_08675, partial [Saprospiraceae bacterium]|nr:hypothetical protein [Saprospiraceae bacterium]